jgi:signal transduction histidine kinase
VVEEFLRMARPQPSELERCSLREELETIVTLTSNDARNRKIKLTLVPQAGDPAVKADGEKLRQAFLNIVINALQATPTGGTVTIATQMTDSMYEIRFNDSGAGIEADTLARVFEPFFTTKPDGTGLGLAITRKIVESHNGTLEIESEPGEGTTVIVRLPSVDGGETT